MTGVPYNVLYINSVSEIAGAEVSLLTQLKSLDREEFFPVVVLPSRGPLIDRLRRAGIETIVVPLHKLNKWNPLSVFPYLRTVYCLARIIRRYQIKLVHMNNFNVNQHAVVAAWLMKVPAICHIRGLIGKTCFELEFLFLTSTLIANSKATENSYKPFMNSRQQTVVVYNGVVLGDFEVDENTTSFREKYGIENDAFLIGCVGQLARIKGQSVLLEAFGQLVSTYPQIRLFIAGDISVSRDTQYQDEVKYLCENLGLSEKVIFGGFVEDIASLYASIDLLAVPSTFESFGRVLIEAMAMKKPVVASRIHGIVEVVEDGVTGLLVQPGDPTELAKAIARIIDDQKLSSIYGAKGKDRVRRLFCATDNTRRIEEIYRKVLGRRT